MIFYERALSTSFFAVKLCNLVNYDYSIDLRLKNILNYQRELSFFTMTYFVPLHYLINITFYSEVRIKLIIMKISSEQKLVPIRCTVIIQMTLI